jgi:hypothetical protein
MSFVRFLVNDKGRKEDVLIDIKLYEKILDELEKLESIRAYDKAKASGDEILPFEKAVKEIERIERQYDQLGSGQFIC